MKWTRPPSLQQVMLGTDPAIVHRLQTIVPNKDGKPVETHGWFFRQNSPQFRWRHDRLAAIVDSGDAFRLSGALAADSQLVKATALIGLARVNSKVHGKELAALVLNHKLPVHVRCAAAETLGTNERRGELLLAKLLDAVCRLEAGELPPHYNRRLHGELLRAYGRFVSPLDNERFSLVWEIPLPAASDVPYARLALIEAWTGAIDEEILELLGSPHPQLRMAVVRLIGRTKKSDYTSEAIRATDDGDHQVASVAVTALGELRGDAAAKAHLKKRAASGPMPVRVAAVKALAAQEDWHTLAQHARDPAWRIRQAVAATLTVMPKGQGAAVAARLIQDNSGNVAKTVVQAVNGWPLPQAAPIYMDALEVGSYSVRRRAAKALAKVWRPARRFPVSSSKPHRTSALKRLRREWVMEYGEFPSRHRVADARKGSNKDTAAKSAGLEPDRQEERQLAAELEHATEAPDRHLLLTRLLRILAGHPAKAATAQQVIRSMRRDDAAALWVVSLNCLRGQPWLDIRKWVAKGQQHATAEVRAAAGGLLGSYADAAAADVWMASLHDRASVVVLATLTGVRKHALPDGRAQKAVEALLQHKNSKIRVSAAAALAKHSQERGLAALERFAADDDINLRRLAAQHIGLTGDKSQLPLLMRLIDDESSVSLLALDSLTQLVGDDAPNFAGDTQSQRIRRWKLWWRKQNKLRAGKIPATK